MVCISYSDPRGLPCQNPQYVRETSRLASLSSSSKLLIRNVVISWNILRGAAEVNTSLKTDESFDGHKLTHLSARNNQDFPSVDCQCASDNFL